MFGMVFAYNRLGQMVPMKFFSTAAACEAFLTSGPGVISVLDDDNDLHHGIDSAKGIFVYDDEQSAFINYNPFVMQSDVKMYYRRHGNDPSYIMDANRQQTLEDILAQQIDELKSQQEL